MTHHIQPVTLQNEYVRLEPLEPHHTPALARTVDAETFRYFATTNMPTDEASARTEVERLRTAPASLAFAVIERATNSIVGSSSYLDIRPEHRGLEIGRTWITARCRGTRVNPSMKLLMLAHAFESPLFEGHPAERVQLKTDARNLRSQAAIAKLGAVREGTLRKHIILPDGFVRDTVMYSITRDEWPAVRSGLITRVNNTPT